MGILQGMLKSQALCFDLFKGLCFINCCSAKDPLHVLYNTPVSIPFLHHDLQEYQSYSYANPAYSSATGHFTQVRTMHPTLILAGHAAVPSYES